MSETPLSDKAINENWPEFVTDLAARLRIVDGDRCDWPDFVADMEARLSRGKATYGDSSFRMSVDDLIENIKEEAVDIPNWSWILGYVRPELREEAVNLACMAFLLYCRLRALRRNTVQ